ncbi:MAG: magnesium transporter CorA family protein [archaeon]
MAISSYSLKNQNVIEHDLKNITLKSGLTWIRAIDPTPDELKTLSDMTNIDLDIFEDTLDETERSRIESEDYVLIIYRAPFYEEDDIVTIPVGFIIKKNIVITISRKSVNSVEQLVKLINYKRGKFIFKNAAPGIVFNIIDKINEEYLNVINRVGDTSDLIEEKIFEISKENVQKILSLNTTLAYFHSSLSANLEVAKILRKGYLKPFRGEYLGLFEDIYLDVMELIDVVKIQRNIINNLFEMQSTIVSNELNVVMKKITAIAAIIMVPTLISGIYGMNFRYIPLADHPQGFYILLCIMLLAVTSLVLYFRHLKWL